MDFRSLDLSPPQQLIALLFSTRTGASLALNEEATGNKATNLKFTGHIFVAVPREWHQVSSCTLSFWANQYKGFLCSDGAGNKPQRFC